MIFTKFFLILGLFYITMSLIDIKNCWVDKMYLHIWKIEPTKKAYLKLGLISIFCGLLLDLFATIILF